MKIRAEFRPADGGAAIPVRSCRYDAERDRIIVVIDHGYHTQIRLLRREPLTAPQVRASTPAGDPEA